MAVEFLVKSNKSNFPKSTPGAFQKYDIVNVQEAGFNWGKKERLGSFVVVTVNTLELKDARKYIEPIMKVSGKDEDGNDIQEMVAVRRYKINYKSLPNLKTIENSGVWTKIELTEADIIDKAL